MDQTINTLMEMSERHKRYADTQEGERRAMYLRFANACVEAAGRLGMKEPTWPSAVTWTSVSGDLREQVNNLAATVHNDHEFMVGLFTRLNKLEARMKEPIYLWKETK